MAFVLTWRLWKKVKNFQGDSCVSNKESVYYQHSMGGLGPFPHIEVLAVSAAVAVTCPMAPLPQLWRMNVYRVQSHSSTVGVVDEFGYQFVFAVVILDLFLFFFLNLLLPCPACQTQRGLL